MIPAVRALLQGLWTMLGAPLLLAGVALLTLAAAAPFALVVGARVQSSLANQQPVSAGSNEIDPEWWMEFREHAQGIEATFTPAIIGFAAPLDNLSSLLDGTRRPLALAGPVVVSGLVWAFLWGGILDRFSRRGRTRLRDFVSAAFRYGPRFVLIGIAAAGANLILYLTVHAALFGPIYEWLAARAASERDAFVWRVALYVVFGALLIAVSVIVDYARVHVVVAQVPTVGGALSASVQFVRRHAGSVLVLYLLTGALFVGLLVVYGSAETLGRTRLGGWRAVAIGQAYIVARLAIRLTFAASEVRLFQQLRGRVPD